MLRYFFYKFIKIKKKILKIAKDNLLILIIYKIYRIRLKRLNFLFCHDILSPNKYFIFFAGYLYHNLTYIILKRENYKENGPYLLLVLGHKIACPNYM